jgi:hypothetical protein
MQLTNGLLIVLLRSNILVENPTLPTYSPTKCVTVPIFVGFAMPSCATPVIISVRHTILYTQPQQQRILTRHCPILQFWHNLHIICDLPHRVYSTSLSLIPLFVYPPCFQQFCLQVNTSHLVLLLLLICFDDKGYNCTKKLPLLHLNITIGVATKPPNDHSVGLFKSSNDCCFWLV